jgi:hypothetical protein
MDKRKVALTLEQELQILQFWAHGMDIFSRFSAETIASVPGLNEALEGRVQATGCDWLGR